MAGRLTLLFLSLLLACWTTVTHSQDCDTITWNPTYGTDPLEAHRGKVVLVTLMKGYCQYCIQQAVLMQAMYERLAQTGMPDVQMMIVNGGEPRSRNRIHNLRRVVRFPVLQDSPDHYLYRRVFRGLKDDTLIYDRCGQRTFFIPFPYSNIAHNITERLLRRTYAGRHFCYCNRDPRQRHNPYNTMYGDAPSGPDGGDDLESEAANFNIWECSETDVVCQRFQNIFGLLNSGVGIGSNQNGNRPRLSVFADQSDFNLQTSRRGLAHSGSMGQMGSGPLNPIFQRRRRIRYRGRDPLGVGSTLW